MVPSSKLGFEGCVGVLHGEGKDKSSSKHPDSEHGSHGVHWEILKCGLCLEPAGSGGHVRTRGWEDELGGRPQGPCVCSLFQ